MNQFTPNQYMNRQPYQTNNSITWVQGIEGAKAWQLPPNSNVLLMDSEIDGRFYIKTSDNIGMCTLRLFDYKEITETPNTNFITRDEVTQMIATAMQEVKREQSVSRNDKEKHTIKQ